MAISSSFERTRQISVILGFVLIVIPLHAEVMDKELSVGQIWQCWLVSAGVATAAALFRKWLLIPSFCFALLNGLLYALTEWWDPFVGPAIAEEAGRTYGLHVYFAIGAMALLHWFLWKQSSRRSLTAWSTSSARRIEKNDMRSVESSSQEASEG